MTRMTLAIALCFVGFASGASAADPDQDPRLLDEFSVTDAGGRKVFTREAGGFRVHAPRNPFDALYAAKGLYRRNVWDIVTSYAVGGDFEYAVNYDVARLGEPDQPPVAETNAEIAIDNRGRDGLIALNVNAMPGTPKCFRTMRVFPGATGMHFNMTTFPRKSDAGRMAIRRRGSELSLLVADGPGEPLVELVRYPHDPRGNPNLRVSAYAGQEASRGTVDVLLSDIAIRAGRVVRGPEARAAMPLATPRASYPVAIDYTRNPAAILTDFNQSNDTAKAFRVEGAGLRLQPPVLPTHVKDAKAYWLRDSRYTLHGDFEFAVKYDITQFGPVGKTGGYRSASVSLGVETPGPLGSVSLSRGLSGDTTQRFSVTHYSPTKAGPQWDTQTFPASAKSGRLVIRRVGSEMSFLVTEGDAPERLLVRRPWDAKPVPRIRLNADQGGTPVTPVNVLFTELTVRAEGLTDLQTGAPIGPPPPPPPVPQPPGDPAAPTPPAAPVAAAESVVFEGAPVEKSNKFRNLGLAAGGGAATLTAAGALALLLRRRRGSAENRSTAEGT